MPSELGSPPQQNTEGAKYPPPLPPSFVGLLKLVHGTVDEMSLPKLQVSAAIKHNNCCKCNEISSAGYQRAKVKMCHQNFVASVMHLPQLDNREQN